MLKGMILATAITIALLVGASATYAHGSGWMGSSSHDSDYMGWCWSADHDHITNSGCGMIHLGHYDLSDEDISRIQEILDEAREEINSILSEYDAGIRDTSTGGCPCCH